MGKKHPTPRSWTVQLTPLYRPDRDTRIAKAYELAVPLRVASPQRPQQKEDSSHDAVSPHRHLRARVQ